MAKNISNDITVYKSMNKRIRFAIRQKDHPNLIIVGESEAVALIGINIVLKLANKCSIHFLSPS